MVVGRDRGRWRPIVRAIVQKAKADTRANGAHVALLRVVRSLRAFTIADEVLELFANEPYRRHEQAVVPDDRLFFLTHNAYMARGLTARQRMACAEVHYRHQATAFDGAFHDSVYDGSGLTLWAVEVDGVRYEVRLTIGNDVLYEGGLSTALLVDDVRVCVLSFSRVEGADIGQGPGPRLLVGRNQLDAGRDYQSVFNRAFNHSHPARFCFAAISGVALALGDSVVAGVRPEVHPGYKAALAGTFEGTYRTFWESFSGTPIGPVAYEIPVPFALTPLADLSVKARRRAVLRRRHLDAVRDSARDAIVSHLVGAAGRPAASPDAAFLVPPADEPMVTIPVDHV